VGEPFRVALIGGASHVGKSTTAQALAARLGWDCASTDKMGRHPGRPWSTATFSLPDHVVEHYRTLEPQQLIEAQLAHYRDVRWPVVLERIQAHAAEGAEPLVIEGSGLLPGRVAALGLAGVRAVWLTAAPELIAARIRRASGYEARDADARAIIDKFTRRSQLYDAQVIDEVRRLGLPLVEVTDAMSPDEVVAACLEQLRR
jgi:2-phosphoglycerate kinase